MDFFREFTVRYIFMYSSCIFIIFTFLVFTFLWLIGLALPLRQSVFRNQKMAIVGISFAQPAAAAGEENGSAGLLRRATLVAAPDASRREPRRGARWRLDPLARARGADLPVRAVGI